MTLAEIVADWIVKPEWLEGCKKNKLAFFVLGPEGSGTNMLRDALVAAGCDWKQGHESYQDDYNFEEMESPFVFRRSLPHAGKWPPIDVNIVDMEEAGFDVHVILILRDFYATAKSVVRRNYQATIEDCFHNQKAIFDCFGEDLRLFHHGEFTYITYEAFCLSEGFRRWLFTERLGLPYPADFQIWYANDQYYEK